MQQYLLEYNVKVNEQSGSFANNIFVIFRELDHSYKDFQSSLCRFKELIDRSSKCFHLSQEFVMECHLKKNINLRRNLNTLFHKRMSLSKADFKALTIRFFNILSK